MKLIKGEFNEKLELQFANSIRAGFPSPAEDYLGESLDFNRDMIRNPEATFYGQVEGNSMIEAGICDGDIAVIDRSIEPHPRYTDYAFHAALHLTDTVFNRRGSRLLLGGGIRFKGDGERFTHDEETDQDDIDLRVDTVFSAQRATGFPQVLQVPLRGT